MNGCRPTHAITAYARLLRLSNLPTCISNVLVGSAVVAGAAPLPPLRVGMVAAAVSLLYAAGMAMNGATDAQTDQLACSDRPIPSGQINVRRAWSVITVLLVLGLATLWATDLATFAVGLILVASITAYNALHKHSAWSMWLMGACRGLVYVTALVAMLPHGSSLSYPNLQFETTANVLPQAVWLIAVLTLYTTILTYIARAEHTATLDGRRWLAMAMPALALSPSVYIRPDGVWWAVTLGLVTTSWLAQAAAYVLRNPVQTRRAVMGWLSGMCLMDAYFLALLDRPGLSLAALVCFMMTIGAHRRIPGT